MDYALEIANVFSASVLILNVFQPPAEISYQPIMASLPMTSDYPQNQIFDQSKIAAIIKDLRKVHETILSEAAKRATTQNPMLKVTTELKEGNTASQIIETATEGKFDLIVVGHVGESEIKEFLLGSTSEKVVHQARCTVTVVK